MNFAQLEYIIAVDNYRQFNLAAEKCFVTQATLSMMVKKLEEELPVRIFMRIHRSYIINLGRIEQVERNQVMVAGHAITVAEPYRPAFQDFISGRSV